MSENLKTRTNQPVTNADAIAVDGDKVEFGGNVEVDGNLKVNTNLSIDGDALFKYISANDGVEDTIIDCEQRIAQLYCIQTTDSKIFAEYNNDDEKWHFGNDVEYPSGWEVLPSSYEVGNVSYIEIVEDALFLYCLSFEEYPEDYYKYMYYIEFDGIGYFMINELDNDILKFMTTFSYLEETPRYTIYRRKFK